jgi:hypothetical protein
VIISRECLRIRADGYLLTAAQGVGEGPEVVPRHSVVLDKIDPTTRALMDRNVSTMSSKSMVHFWKLS